MDAKGLNPGDKVYVDFEPSMEWAWEDKWGTLILYLPGFSKQQLRVQVSASGMLKLSGERPIGGERWNRFYKEVQIPKNCDNNSITAKFENNILFVQLPKNVSTTPSTSHKPGDHSTKPQPESRRQPTKEPPTKTPPPQEKIPTTNEPPLPAPPPQGQQLIKQPSKGQKPTDEPYTPTEQKRNQSEDNTFGIGYDHKTMEKGGEGVESREHENDKRGGQEGSNGGSTEKVATLDREAPSRACGSSPNSTLENYTRVVGGLARDLRKGGKLFNFAVTVLVALLLGIYFGNMIKSSEKPKI